MGVKETEQPALWDEIKNNDLMPECQLRFFGFMSVVIAIWFCVASYFVGKRLKAADFLPRFRTTQNHIAICKQKRKKV